MPNTAYCLTHKWLYASRLESAINYEELSKVTREQQVKHIGEVRITATEHLNTGLSGVYSAPESPVFNCSD